MSAYSDHELSWRNGVVLVIDVVESVRLMTAHQGLFVRRWVHLRKRIESEILAPSAARIVKSLGDGMLVEFQDVRSAVAASIGILELLRDDNAQQDGELAIALRAGLEVGEFLSDERDVYGNPANIAARLCGLAEPNEIVISAGIRGRLTDAVDADIDDLGDCFLKHVDVPVRAYRIRRAGSTRSATMPASSHDLIPTVAVIPFADRKLSDNSLVLGDVIADELIHTMSRSRYMSVISRLSTSVFRWRRLNIFEIATHLKAKYVISGSYAAHGGKLHVDVELAEARSGQVVLHDRFTFAIAALANGDFQAFDAFVAAATTAMIARELVRIRRQSMPTLESYSMLLGAIALMHRPAPPDFAYARELLEALCDRLPRESVPKAWLAVWYTIKVQQGLSDTPDADGLRANELALRALSIDPESSLGLSVCGLIHTNFLKKFDDAERFLDLAIAANPNDSLAILHKSALYQFTDRGKSAYGLNLHARALSPRDPHRYYYEAIAASCAFSAGEYELALQHARESLRSNQSYASAARVRVASLWQLGRREEAQLAVNDLMTLEPNLTVSRWLSRSPAAGFEVGKRLSGALSHAGVPN